MPTVVVYPSLMSRDRDVAVISLRGARTGALAGALALALSAVLAPALAQQPEAARSEARLPDDRSFDELLQAARAAARADRNRESADLFALAIAKAPDRRRELL